MLFHLLNHCFVEGEGEVFVLGDERLHDEPERRLDFAQDLFVVVGREFRDVGEDGDGEGQHEVRQDGVQLL